uniref:DRBM domain-containing protein n=2 Tax=Cucumis sativus TaxID=3659 RepID=A0A0A0KE35_CUCSA
MIPCIVNESNASESGIKVEDGILATNPCIAECSGEKLASGNLSDNISFDQNRNGDHALITCQSNPDSEHLSKLQAIIVSKERALSQAAIRALIRKRDKLSHQQRLIEDEIAQCDKNMQTILRGDEDDLVLKLDSVIECCNDICPRSTAEDKSYQYFEENCSSQYVTRKRLSEAILCIQNPCLELDGICHKNNWILPVYGVSSLDGGFQANVFVKGMDFEYSSCSELCSDPRDARESAAMKMLGQLWRMANLAK